MIRSLVYTGNISDQLYFEHVNIQQNLPFVKFPERINEISMRHLN
jgi:hypothetical protein